MAKCSVVPYLQRYCTTVALEVWVSNGSGITIREPTPCEHNQRRVYGVEYGIGCIGWVGCGPGYGVDVGRGGRVGNGYGYG